MQYFTQEMLSVFANETAATNLNIDANSQINSLVIHNRISLGVSLIARGAGKVISPNSWIYYTDHMRVKRIVNYK